MKKIDFHVHHHEAVTNARGAEYLRDMMERHGYSGICLQALPHSSEGFSTENNENCMEVSRLLPNSYCFAGLNHDRDLIEQTKEYMERGFKGIKLLEGKPSEWRAHKHTYSEPRFMEFFDFCEKEQIPLMIHNNDPLINWDLSKADARAIEKGWVYDAAVPSQEWFFEQLETALLAHPNLRAALAHFGFYSNDIPRARRLMEACPKLHMDITPALCIYGQLSETPAEAEAFFREYHTRILYGTDADSNLNGFPREYNDLKVRTITHFLEGDAPKQIGKQLICPIRLDQEMLENIYYNNALRFIKE